MLGARPTTLLFTVFGTTKILATDPTNPTRVIGDRDASSSLIMPTLSCQSPEPNIDYNGNDIAEIPTPIPDVCCWSCIRVWGCFAYTWSLNNGGTCYLKSQAGNAQYHPPNSDGSPYAISNEVYRCGELKQDKELIGEDLGSVPSSHPLDCCRHCQLTTDCKAFTWTRYTSEGGTCYLKGNFGDGRPPPNVLGLEGPVTCEEGGGFFFPRGLGSSVHIS